MQYRLITRVDRVAIKIMVPKVGSGELTLFTDLTLFHATLKTVMGVWSRRVKGISCSLTSSLKLSSRNDFYQRLADVFETTRQLLLL